MNVHREVPTVLETVYREEDLQRVHESEQPTTENTGNPAYSAAIMRQFRKAKKASKSNDERSRRIVKALNKERKKMDRVKNKAKKIVEPPVKRVQRTLMDF